MNQEKEILALHRAGFVLLRASRNTNSPIGWKRAGKKRWGYAEEMEDPALTVYKTTFNASILSKSHCGFYLGHGNLCCIDLDSKKSSTTIEQTTQLKDAIIKALPNSVAVETTKSNGYHIYFLYSERLPNVPDWTGIKMIKDGIEISNNWIELYYSKRFMACWLSNTKKYTLIHGNLLKLKPLTKKQHSTLLKILHPFKGKQTPRTKRIKQYEIDENTQKEVENYIAQIEERELDITGDNPKWFRIGKALASAFGLKGFNMFKRVSQFSPTYNEDTIEEVYNRFVEDDARPRAQKISIGTFFKICEDAGLHDSTTIQAIRTAPQVAKEFEIELSKKERMSEHTHKVVIEFIKYMNICCLDNATFYVFKDTHWQRVNDRFVVECIHDFILRSTIPPKIAQLFHTVPYIDLMLKELRLVTQRDSLDPYTGNLKEGIYINMENGVLHINVKNGKRKLLDHDPNYNFTTVLPYPYDPSATCERFDTWLDTQVPNKDLQICYYAFVASCLTKHKTDNIMLLVGDTSTGKSSLIDITRRVIGIESSVAISAGTLFSNRPDSAVQAMLMENKLLAYDFDSRPFTDLEMLLKVAAQEPIIGWQMHVTRRPVTNYGRVLIAMNPNNYSVFNRAVARRLITINMDTEVKKDNTVIPAIYENELAGIFNRVLNRGVKHLIENNGQVKVTEEMKQASMRFHMDAKDSIRWFNSKYVVLKPPVGGSTKTTIEQKYKQANPGIKIVFLTVSEMYADFRVWAEDVEGIPINKILQRKYFVADLKLYGVDSDVYRLGSTIQRGVWVGQKPAE